MKRYISILLILTIACIIPLSLGRECYAADTADIPRAGLVGEWLLDGNANDTCGSNNGTVMGAVPVPDRFGNKDSAYSFNGVDNWIKLGPMYNKETGSVSAWFKFTGNSVSTKDLQVIFAWGGPQNDANIPLFYHTFFGDKSILFGIYNHWDWEGDIADSNIIPADSAWYHAVCTWGPDTGLKLYINGTLAAVQSYSGPVTNSSEGYFGRDSWYDELAGFFGGELDNIRLYDRVLNDSEVLALYNESSGPSVSIMDAADFPELYAGDRIKEKNLDGLCEEKREMKGAATDGTARLLIRLKSGAPGKARFKLEGEGAGGSPVTDGQLYDLKGKALRENSEVQTVKLSDNNSYAFAIYKSPEGFVRNNDDNSSSERKLVLKTTFIKDSDPAVPLEERKGLILKRPPIVLVHGIWSGPEKWRGFAQKLRDMYPGLSVYQADYARYSAYYFNVNKDVVRYWVDDVALKGMKENGFAAVQADIVGHSMGGILARIWASGEFYKNSFNYGDGDIDKLITIDSPHEGSIMAKQIMDFLKRGTVESKAFRDLADRAGYDVDLGAVEDLAQDSRAIRDLNKTKSDVPCYAIAGATTSTMASSWDFSPEMFLIPYFGIPAYPSDIIVPLESQLGGLSKRNASIFDHVHTKAVDNPLVFDKVVQLMNLSAEDRAFSKGFPTGSGKFKK